MNERKENLTERQKTHMLYNLIGERGLYVNSNHDVFAPNSNEESVEEVPDLSGYRVPLIHKGCSAYASPLLFATLTALFNNGTMLLTGSRGIGKTTSAEYAGHFYRGVDMDEILAAEIQGNPQLKTEDTIAELDTVRMVHDGEKVVLPSRFLQCGVKIWDEVNRTPADLLSATMRLVDTGKASYKGVLLQGPKSVLYATANYADEGTFQLTPPFLDRFDVAVQVTSPTAYDLREIRNRGDGKLNGKLEGLLQIPDGCRLDLDKVRKEIAELEEDPGLSTFVDFGVYGMLRFSEIASDNLARATKGNAWLINQDQVASNPNLSVHFSAEPHVKTLDELSVRAVNAAMRYARAYAWFNGKNRVDISDAKTVLPYALWHKINPTRAFLDKNPKCANDRIDFVQQLLTDIETEHNAILSDRKTMDIYTTALRAISDERLDVEEEKDEKKKIIDGRQLSYDEIRNIARNAIQEIGKIDKPGALILASHVASEFNNKYNGVNGG